MTAAGGQSLNGWLAIPLVARDDRLIGLLEVADKGEGEFTANDEAMAVQLAQMTAGALENARLYEREHHIAQTLQQSLLPAHLPEIPGATVAASYRAAGEGQEVGGDFYDVFAVDDRRWLLVIGDVCGKGPQAAAITALARYTVRATALRETHPADILATLNQAMLAQLRPMYFCSVACASMIAIAIYLTTAFSVSSARLWLETRFAFAFVAWNRFLDWRHARAQAKAQRELERRRPTPAMPCND